MNKKYNPLLIILLIIIIIFMLFGCDNTSNVQLKEQTLELSKTTENYHQHVSEYTYEGCEYIKVGYGKSTWGSHKGNCINPIHNK
jgi:outer membrane biogenesis lipoprotein LolB